MRRQNYDMEEAMKEIRKIQSERKGKVNLLTVALVISLALATVKLIGLMALTWFQVLIPVFIVLGFSAVLVVLLLILSIIIFIVGAMSR